MKNMNRNSEQFLVCSFLPALESGAGERVKSAESDRDMQRKLCQRFTIILIHSVNEFPAGPQWNIDDWNLEPGSKQPQLLSVLVGADTLDTGATRGRGIRNHIPLSAAELFSAAAAGIFKSLTNSPAFVLKLLNFEFVLVGVGITADCAINQLHNSMIHETNNEQYHPTPNTAGTSLCFGQKCRFKISVSC